MVYGGDKLNNLIKMICTALELATRVTFGGRREAGEVERKGLY
jgi:hypothetical protein